MSESPMPRAAGVSLAIEVDRESSVPLPDQLVAAFRRLITTGGLRPDEPVPSSRRLAAHLGVSRGTVESAYAQLGVEGYLVSAERAATRVNPDLPGALQAKEAVPRPAPAPRRRSRELVDLRPGHGGDDPLREPAFRRSWRESLDVDSGPIDPLGQPAARWAIADHLRLVRGMDVDPDAIILTSGSRDGLRLLFSAGLTGAIAVENPGFPGLRLAMTDRELVPFDVSEGLDEAELIGLEGRVAAIVVTPNHQFPHGATMPVDRRVRLLDWAGRHGVLVVEDDYDSEARYRRTAVPTLYELARTLGTAAEVVHVGTFSTLLTSAVSTGYLLARGPIAAELMRMRRALGPAFSPVMQTALAGYLGSGGLRRRIGRGRRRLRAAEVVLAEVGPIPGLVHEGRTLVIETGEEEAERLRQDLAARGILVASLAAGWSGDSSVHHGIVIAHSNVDAEVLRAALTTVQRLLGRNRRLRSGRA